jgi:endo-1,4-beta-xylanase
MGKNRFSRRNFLKMAGAVSAGLSLTACGVKATDVRATDLPIPTQTLVPTATLTFTPTPIPPTPTAAPTMTPSPTVEVKVADLPQTKVAVDQFVAAMNSAGVQAEAEQIRQGLSIKEITGKDGKQYEIALTQDGYPLMIKAGKGWIQVYERLLVDLFNPDFLMGATADYPIYGDEFNRPNLEVFLAARFNSLILENHLRWNGLEITAGSIDDTRILQVKKLVDFAKANNQTLLGQHIFFYTEYPDWLKSGQFTKEQLIDIIQNRVDIVMKTFPEIKTWVVANEFHPISLGWHEDYLQSKLGTQEALLMMFQAAQQANPNATLLISDSHNETINDTNFQKTLDFITYLKQKGIENVGVGMHLHRKASSQINQNAMKEAMLKLDVPIFITEADSDLSDIEVENKGRLIMQANEFNKELGACLEVPNCKGFFIWNPGDNSSFLEQNFPNADPTPFFDDLSPKPADYSILKVLFQYAESFGSN